MIFDAISSIKESMSKDPISLTMSDKSTKKIIELYNQMGLSADAFVEKTELSDKALISYFKTTESGNATLKGCKAHIDNVNGSIGMMGIKAKATTVIMTGLKTVLSGIITGAIIALISKFIQSLVDSIPTAKKIREEAEKAKEKINEITSSLKEQKDTVEEVKQRYAKLAQGVNQISGKNLMLSNDDYQEFLDISNQLAKLFPALTKNYDDNGNAILNLSGNVNNIVSSLDELLEREQKIANKQALSEMPSIYNDYENKINGYTNQLENAQKKQKDYLKLYNQLQNTNYDVSDDKKAVTFHFGNINEEDKSKLAQELTSSFDDLNDYIIQDLGTLNNHDTVMTLYLENGFDGFEARLKSAQDEISEYSTKIKSEIGSFSTYMNTWLQGNWLYQQQNQEMQNALQQVLFNKDWINIAKSELGDNTGWDKVSQWIEDKYINAISSINNKEIRQDFIDLFTLDLTPEDTINLAQELQDYFEENEILVSLDFILDESDPDSTQNLVSRFQKSLEERGQRSPIQIQQLKEYTKNFTEAQMQKWLELTGGIYGAQKAINEFEKETKTSNEYVNFFTDDNLKSIDDYKSKLSDLSSYLTTITEKGKLSSEEMSKLNTEYGIFSNSIDEYKSKILSEITAMQSKEEVIEVLTKSIQECTNAEEKLRLETLLRDLENLDDEAINAAEGFDTLENAISTLQSRAELLKDINEDIKKYGKIDISGLNKILSVYPELEEKVALYNAGLMSSNELFAQLKEAYVQDGNLYAKYMADKLQYTEKFYNSVFEAIPKNLKDLADFYHLDLQNYATLCAAKLGLDAELANRRALLYEAIEDDYNISRDHYATDVDRKKVHDKYLETQKAYNDIQSIIDGVMKSVSEQFTVDWELVSNDDNNSITEIDWASQALSVLQEVVDDVQISLENTKGLEAQIKAINVLNDALLSLKNGYQTAFDEYSKRYTKNLGKLSNSKEIQFNIESGKSFDLSQYSSEDAKIIQECIDLYEKIIEANDKVLELELQIDNIDLNKSKFLQAQYESELDSIQIKLEDQTLTTSEKNELLKKELAYQKLINEELAKQAIYNGDIIGAQNLRSKNAILEQETEEKILQNKSNKNDIYRATNEEYLKNTNLTTKEINALNQSRDNYAYTDFKNRFQGMRNMISDDAWNGYIQKLMDKYDEDNLNEKTFIKKHFSEIAKHFAYTGMQQLQYEVENYNRNANERDYETAKNVRLYYINNNNNKIADIQNEIVENGSRGTEQNYKDIQNFYNSNLDYWKQQNLDAEAMLNTCIEGTQAWNDWNAEIQECEDNISSCKVEIKNCELAILKLPLNDIEDELRYIENQLNDINQGLEDNNHYMAAANYIIDREIRKYEKAKEILEDQVTALEKSNEARKTSIDLQQKEYNLEKLKNQKTSKIYREGQGWTYEADHGEVLKAQSEFEQALFDNKIAILNRQIKDHDEEIKQLNRIKENWSWIATEAQGVVDINKALIYDSQFEQKVLSGNAELLKTLSNNMATLYSDKQTYEDSKKRYEKLQDLINDTATEYELEAIGYEEARQKISTAIREYYPEVFEKYGTESDKIDKIIDKKLKDANVTKESNSNMVYEVKSSNKKILKSYNKLLSDLDEVFSELNNLMQTYVDNTRNMSNNISDIISTIKRNIESINNIETVDINVDIKEKLPLTEEIPNAPKKTKKSKIQTAGESHSGMELGYIGDGNLSSEKKTFKYIALNELKDNEIVRILQRGEGVVNSAQVQNIMSNFNKLSQVKTPTLLPHTQTNKSVNFNGDIIVQEVQDVDNFAKQVKTQLPQLMMQELYK